MDTHIHKVDDPVQYVGPADGDLLPGDTGRVVGIAARGKGHIVVTIGSRTLVIKDSDERFRKIPTDERD